ncbi:Ria1p [Malassezia vespertilionis]|uniref:Ribosome assembly protein 1 n=1 Tax=Malassezia vespertilionis TaxID=2020962 RepID=A0A2N1JGS2_9BASI|nr:Ria1p [Malassezia vespertilionis]
MPPREFASRNIRCCTLVGHVDHGKSSYADSLLAANGIISSRSAGQVRYLDSRADEQERGITMESSAVSLTFKLRRLTADDEVSEIEDYTLNLIDTPGHVDFSSEVSTASRLCDGALVIVDVVEGICSQTVAVLRQVWLDGLRTVLVLNKMDRLITELKLTPDEAHHRLMQLVEQANAVIGGFYAAERMEQDQRWHDERDRLLAARSEGGEDDLPAYRETRDDDLYFDPPRGNVIFASAIDHWGFRLDRFAQMYARKLGSKEATIRQFLWGNFYLDPKTKRVLTQKQMLKEKRNLRPMFVQFVLENIWRIYEHTVELRDQDMVDKIIAALSLTIHPRDLRSKDNTALMHAIMSQWLPLSPCTFGAIVHNLPSPVEAQPVRVPHMIRLDIGYFATEEELAPHSDLERDLFEARAGEDASLVVYVSKMFAVSAADLPENKRVQLSADEMRERGRALRAQNEQVQSAMAATGASAAPPAPRDEHQEAETPDAEIVLGFARIYSGSLRVGETVCAVLPKYRVHLPPSHPSNAPFLRETRIDALYMMMGRDLIAVQQVPAGNVFAVGGLAGTILRNGTLMRGTDEVVNLAGVRRNATPIVRVALEPKNPAEMPKLVEGLRLLNQADPCVEVMVQDNGEHVILTAGELHLERCLKDLRERFARCKIQQSPPLVPFRETGVKGTNMPPPKTEGAARGTIQGTALQNQVQYTIRAVPMPEELVEFLVVNQPTIRRLHRSRRHLLEEEEEIVPEDHECGDEDRPKARRVPMRLFWPALEQLLHQLGPKWAGIADRICAFGPRHTGPNLLVDLSGHFLRGGVRQRTQDPLHAVGEVQLNDTLDRELSDAVEHGFQLATSSGPLAAEPMQGMAFFVEHVSLHQDADAPRPKMAQVASALISGVREACKQGLLDWSPRLMLAMYYSEIQATPEVQGKVHAVLSRRRGRVLSEEMKEGTLFFTVGSLLPVVESFGFADEIRKRTSGGASPQLLFAGFRLFDMDPFWVPTTEEELEDLGEKGDRENVAKKYMDMVRKRKVCTGQGDEPQGLFTTRRLVASAEKQRTLKSN